MDTIHKAFKFRFYPTLKQKNILNGCFRCCDFIYNYFLKEQIYYNDIFNFYGLSKQQKKESLKKDNGYFNRFEASRELTQMSKTNSYSFLTLYPSTMRSYTLKSLDNAFSSIYKKGTKYPKFKNKKDRNKSFTVQIPIRKNLNSDIFFPCGLDILQKTNKKAKIKIPFSSKINLGYLDVIIHNEEFFQNWNLTNKIKFNSYTISKDIRDNYYISFQTEIPFKKPEKKKIVKESTVGVDMGVSRPITLSDDIFFDDEFFINRFDLLKSNLNEIKRLNEILSNKKKGSNKRNRIRLKLSKIHEKITNQRNWLQHQISNKLLKIGYDTIIFEDLSIKNMLTSEGYGKKSRKTLNRSILDVGFHSIYLKTEYKAELLGINIKKVDPKNTSKKCNNCGHISKKNRKTQKDFKCVECGHIDNADINAAKNIKNKYFEILHN